MDGYFGFGSDMTPLDEGPDEDDDPYDVLNNETFGDFEEDDWELTHEKLAFDFGKETNNAPEDEQLLRSGQGGSRLTSYLHTSHTESHDQDFFHEEDLEKNISQLVLDDEDEFYDAAIMQASKSASQPISIGKDSSRLGQLFGPGSPPSLFDPQLISPTAKPSIWGSPHAEQAKKKSAEDSLKAMLNIGSGAGDPPWHDPAVLHAVAEKAPAKILTLEEIEKGTAQKGRVLPHPSSQPPEPPKVVGAHQLPIGTPPRGNQGMLAGTQPVGSGGIQTAMQQRQATPIHPQFLQYWTQKLHQMVGGRVSPSQISQLIMKMHTTSGRISPDQLRHVLMTGAPARQSTPQAFPPGPVRTPQIPRPPHNMSYPPPPFPFPTPNRTPLSQHQGSPIGRGGMMPPGTPIPIGMGNNMGMPPPAKSLYGLTPMHPRIPPVRPNTDPTHLRRIGVYPQNRGGPYTVQRGRLDGRPPYRRNEYSQNRDEYSNLMTQREKDWVIRIQMLAVQSDNPMVADYYYQVMLQRRLNRAKEKDAEKTPDGSSPRGDEAKEEKIIRMPLTKHSEHREYKPAQFEGALGRVTASSVNNPRPLIDVHSIQLHDEEEGKVKDHGRRRKTLLSIEQMYNLLLQANDVSYQLNGLPESDTGALLEKRQQLLNKVYQSFKIQDISNEKSSNDCLLQLLGIRKGRKLICRVLPKLTDEQSSSIVNIMVHHLVYILKKEALDIKKDSVEGVHRKPEETLPHMFTEISQIIERKTMPELVSLVKHLLSGSVSSSSSSQQASSPSVVTYAMQNKFGSSLMLCILSRAESLFSSTSSKSLDSSVVQDWAGCVDVIAQDLCVTPDTHIAKPFKEYPQALEHFKHFVSKQSFNALDKRLRPLSIG